MGGRAARALIPVALATCLVAGALASSAAAKEPRVQVPQDFFAVGGGWLNQLAFEGDRAELERHTRRMAKLGIESARIAADWQTAEYAPPVLGVHSFNFSTLDLVVQALARFRVRPTMFLIGSPEWARGSTGALCGYRTTPPNEAFAAFARAVASRYGPGGGFWERYPALPYMPVRQFEVWNEENWLGYVCPAIDPERYGQLFLATSTAIHAVNPTARVILGGLVGLREDKYDSNLYLHGMQPVRFVSRMLSAVPRLRGEIGGVGYHSYAIWPAENLDLLRWFRLGLRTLDLGGTPIIYNEFGWPTRGRDARVITEAQRSLFITRLATWAARSDCNISQIAPHTWATPEKDSDNAEDWFGIADPLTAEPHDAGSAYSRVAMRYEGKLRKKPPRGRLAVCAG